MAARAGRDDSAQILVKLLTVDGDSSGLDADLLKGVDSIPGKILQVATEETSALFTTSATIAQDDSIPQSSEGLQWISNAFTPINSSSTVIVIANAFLGSAGGQGAVVPIFTSEATDAKAVMEIVLEDSQSIGNATCIAIIAGWSGARTVSSRFGRTGAAALYLNGRAAARLFSTTTKSTLTIIEVGT